MRYRGEMSIFRGDSQGAPPIGHRLDSPPIAAGCDKMPRKHGLPEIDSPQMRKTPIGGENMSRNHALAVAALAFTLS
ncbi:MAG: hypothetical protein CME06_04355 [Gemmatimonadetes bacterium]|nr:hypothetical protein [Gemmatimonadota bacterium]